MTTKKGANENQKSLLEGDQDDPNRSRMNATCIYNPKLTGGEGEDGATGKLYAACVVAFIFLLTEVVMGLIAGSLAILSDAAHMFSDIFGFCLSIIAISIAKKKASKNFSFGYQRAEILGALGSITLIWCLTVLLLYEATTRIINYEFVKDPLIMLITAGLGLFFNLCLAKILHGHHGGIGGHDHGHDHGHGHGHGHSHGHEDKKKEVKHDHKDVEQPGEDHHHEEEHGHKDSHSHEKGHIHNHEEQENINVRAAFIHVVGDIIQSIGVLIAALFIYLFGTTDKWNPWHLFDPICTYIFCILVMLTTRGISKQCIYILMESTPMKFEIEKFEQKLLNIQNVKSIHNVHVWNINQNNIAMIAHIKADQQYHAQILAACKNTANEYEINIMTVQIEEKHSHGKNTSSVAINKSER